MGPSRCILRSTRLDGRSARVESRLRCKSGGWGHEELVGINANGAWPLLTKRRSERRRCSVNAAALQHVTHREQTQTDERRAGRLRERGWRRRIRCLCVHEECLLVAVVQLEAGRADAAGN